MKRPIQPIEVTKCKYCGFDLHSTGTLICDALTESPLPYVTSLAVKTKPIKNTEPFKLITEKLAL